MKIYQVIFVDEWNNSTHIGFFKDLNDAIPELNSIIEGYGVTLKEGDIVEHGGTFGPYFDTYLSDIFYDESNELGSCMIRGFIFDKDELLKEINHGI